jgi:hypothetical protein
MPCFGIMIYLIERNGSISNIIGPFILIGKFQKHYCMEKKWNAMIGNQKLIDKMNFRGNMHRL